MLLGTVTGVALRYHDGRQAHVDGLAPFTVLMGQSGIGKTFLVKRIAEQAEPDHPIVWLKQEANIETTAGSASTALDSTWQELSTWPWRLPEHVHEMSGGQLHCLLHLGVIISLCRHLNAHPAQRGFLLWEHPECNIDEVSLELLLNAGFARVLGHQRIQTILVTHSTTVAQAAVQFFRQNEAPTDQFRLAVMRPTNEEGKCAAVDTYTADEATEWFYLAQNANPLLWPGKRGQQ